MTYARLTKEQFDELEKEFVNFLATQSITGDEWAKIKKETPEVAEQELDVFSDLVWEGVLTNAKYLEHVSPDSLHMFSMEDEEMKLIGIKIKNDKDLTTPEGFNWLRENLMDDSVEFVRANKAYTENKNLDKFTLLQQGAIITKGDLYNYFFKLLN